MLTLSLKFVRNIIMKSKHAWSIFYSVPIFLLATFHNIFIFIYTHFIPLIYLYIGL